MRLAIFALVLPLAGCWEDEVEVREYRMDAEATEAITLESEAPLWVTFVAPEDMDHDALEQICPVPPDAMSDQAFCAEIAQVLDDGLEVARIRGVIGAGMKFTPQDGRIDLRFTNFASRPITYALEISDEAQSGFR